MTSEPLRFPTPANDVPDPPDHLSAESSAWWRETLAVYVLQDHHIRLLQAACEAWDRTAHARRTIKREGAYFKDRFGQPKAHPALAEERASRNEFRLLVREIGLDSTPTDSRPPRMY